MILPEIIAKSIDRVRASWSTTWYSFPHSKKIDEEVASKTTSKHLNNKQTNLMRAVDDEGVWSPVR